MGSLLLELFIFNFIPVRQHRFAQLDLLGTVITRRVPEQIVPKKNVTGFSTGFDRGLFIKFLEFLVVHFLALVPFEVGEDIIYRSMSARPHSEATAGGWNRSDQPHETNARTHQFSQLQTVDFLGIKGVDVTPKGPVGSSSIGNRQ